MRIVSVTGSIPGVLLLLAVVACSGPAQPRRASPRKHSKVEKTVDEPQRQSVKDAVGESLYPAFQKFFGRSGISLSQTTVDTLAAAMVTRTVQALQSAEFDPCPHLKTTGTEWFQCLTSHVLQRDMQNPQTVAKLASKYFASQGESDRSRLASSDDFRGEESNLRSALNALCEKKSLEDLAEELNASSKDLAQLIRLMNGRSINIDAPYISETFFANREFVFSYGLEESSLHGGGAIPSSANIGSSIVRVKTDSGRFNLVETTNDAAIAEVPVASYPILDVRKIDGVNHFQVDFSAPVGGDIRWGGSIYTLAELSDNPGITIKPSIVLPTLLHKNRPPLPDTEGRTPVFSNRDNAIVVEHLMVLKEALPENKPTEEETNRGRSALRPVVRVITGLTAIDDSSRAFALKASVDPVAARENLRIRLNYESSENELPFLLAGRKRGGRGVEPSQFRAAKFNLDRSIVFVISGRTPAAYIPAIKSALLAYQTLFTKLGASSVQISAQTEEEFLADHPDIPAPLRATDPRVNLIVWDNNMETGAFWSTSVRNGDSGEVVSGDIHLPGTLWGHEGCVTFLERTWKRSADEPVVPSRKTRIDWIHTCDQIASRLDGVSSIAPPLSRQTDRQNNTTSSRFTFGSNTVTLIQPHSNFVSFATPSDSLALADWGAPGVTSEFLKEPEQAAVAAVRAALLHELGHLFGLRHNFLGSGLTAQLSPHVPPPFPLFSRTDSIMDYNDPAIELDLGAMRDITSPEGALDLPTFGSYDVLALAELYKLDSSGFRFTRRASFCTDGDNKVGNTCKPLDYGLVRKGHEYGEYLLHRLNMKAIELASISDAMEVLGFDWKALKNLLGQVAEVWANWQDLHDESRVEYADMLFDPDTWQKQPEHKFTNNFLDALRPKYDLARIFGLGTPFLLKVDSDFPGKDPMLIDTGLQLLRENTMQVINMENRRLLAERTDSGRDIPLEIANLPAIDMRYRDLLLDAFAGEAIIPAGRRVLALFFDSNAVFSQFVTLKEPFLNHHANNCDVEETVTLPNGNVKTLKGKVAGHYDTAALMTFAEAAAFVAPGKREWRNNPTSPGASATRLKQDLEILKREAETSQIPLIGNATSLLLDRYESLIESIDKNQATR